MNPSVNDAHRHSQRIYRLTYVCRKAIVVAVNCALNLCRYRIVEIVHRCQLLDPAVRCQRASSLALRRD